MNDPKPTDTKSDARDYRATLFLPANRFSAR